ncbi:EAL domain-containing protein [Radicibacter daui]|uniref:EAL domain-containing protein n=1 Tax=Radicibacter daui TaxID=3064829 RepID=UPI00404704D7
MTARQHTIFFAAYVLLAAVVAFCAPLVWPEVDEANEALVLGLCVLLAGGLLHEIAARRAATRELRELINQRLRATPQPEGVALGAPAAASDADVAPEAEMLQAVVEQISAVVPPGAPGSTALALAEELKRDAEQSIILRQLREAVRRDRVEVFLQPIVSLPQRRHRYYEVFSRIRGEAGEIMGPDQYLALAEREGLIGPLDNLLLLRCIQLIRESKKRDYNYAFFVNMSANTLADTRFMQSFLAFMQSHRQIIPRLVLELNQETMLSGGPAGGKLLEGLAQLGFIFSMDNVTHFDIDFAALKRRNVRFVKLEAPALAAELGKPSPFSVPRLLSRADDAGIDLIVEKVESEDQMRLLAPHHLDFGQGFLFGEPKPSTLPQA